MTLDELIARRESVRKYIDKAVPRELTEQCLEAARLAPSACNSQPWSFLVIEDAAIRAQICEEVMSGIYSSNKFVKSAPTLVAMITESSDYTARLGGMLRNVKYNLIDIGIAGEHFALKAAELGLGTCWLGWFNETKLKKILNLPKSTKIDIMFSLGYSDPETPPRPKKRKTLSEMARFI